MTIKKKLIFSTVAINLALLIIGIMLLLGYRHVMGKASLANDFDKESMYLQMMLRGLNEAIISEGTPDSVLIGRTGLDGFDVIHEKLLKEVSEPKLQKVIKDTIDPAWQDIKEKIRPLFIKFENYHDDDTLVMAGKYIVQTERLFTRVKNLAEETRAVVNNNSRLSEIVQYAIIAAIIIVLFVSLNFSYRTYNAITSPIAELNKIAKGFTRGQLDAKMDESRKDEFGVLAHHFNASITKLNQYTNELKDFTHIASHDLQEPLRKILSFSERIQSEYADVLGQRGQHYISRLQKSVSRVRKLVDDLMLVNQLAYRSEQFETVDLYPLAQEAVSNLQERIEQTGGNVEIDTLPALKVDPPEMRELLQNLISNALKFSKPDEPPVIKVTGEFTPVNNIDGHNGADSAQFFQLSVKDNGIGFDEKYTDRIFRVFQRLHGEDEYTGSGIGLYICQKIAEKHEGSITVTSKEGEGSMFTVTLPAENHNGDEA